jgi:hypothetical protein
MMFQEWFGGPADWKSAVPDAGSECASKKMLLCGRKQPQPLFQAVTVGAARRAFIAPIVSA